MAKVKRQLQEIQKPVEAPAPRVSLAHTALVTGFWIGIKNEPPPTVEEYCRLDPVADSTMTGACAGPCSKYQDNFYFTPSPEFRS